MKQITFENITSILNELTAKSEDEYYAELDRMEEEQPEIWDFLFNREELNDVETDILVHTAQLGWYIIKKVLNRDAVVSEDYIYEQFDRNLVQYRGNLTSGKKSDSELAETMHTPNNQPLLIDYLLNQIIDIYEDPEKPIREEHVAAMIVDIKTIVDSLVIDEEVALAETCDSDWSDKSFESVESSVKRYYEEFKKTAPYMKLGHNEKKEAEFIITGFGEMMYNYFFMLPEHWNPRRTVECLTEKMPAKVMAGDDFFKAIEPVMVPFMLFCSEKGYVPDGASIAERLDGITEHLMEEAGDKENWSMGKSLLKDAESQGYDLTKQEDIDAFLKSYNKDKEKAFLQQGKVNDDKPGRNDLCPCGSGKKYKKCCGADV